jgi:ATP-dependent DNA helicase RecG
MVSVRRNELITELFHRIHFIEKWGRGIKLILSKEPKTVFKEVGNLFVTVFKRKNISFNKNTILESSEKGSEKILAMICANNQISAKEIAGNLNISSRAVEKHIHGLKKRGSLERIGSDKGGYWQVITAQKRSKNAN